MRASPDRLATRYGLLISGANVALVLAAWLAAGRGGALLHTALSLVSWIVFLGSLLLIFRLGFVTARHYGTVGAAFGPGLKAGLLVALVTFIGAVVYVAGSGQINAFDALGPSVMIATFCLSALIYAIISALIAGGVATLGAVFAISRARSA